VASSRRKGRVNDFISVVFIFAVAGMLVSVGIFIQEKP